MAAQESVSEPLRTLVRRRNELAHSLVTTNFSCVPVFVSSALMSLLCEPVAETEAWMRTGNWADGS
jgi:hypothetical protein